MVAWTRDKGRGSKCLIRLIVQIAFTVGRSATLPLLHVVTLYFVLFSTARRQASRTYLQGVLGRRPHWWEVYRHYWTFAILLLDRAFIVGGRTSALSMEIHASKRARELAFGRPCLFLSAHFGSFEALRYFADQENPRSVRPLMYREQNQTADQVLEEVNPGIWASVIRIGHPYSMIQATEAVAAGESIAMLGDRDAAGHRALRCRFMDGEILLPPGPMLVAHALQIPVLLCFGIYRGSGHYELLIEVFAESIDLPRAHRETDLQQWVQRFASRLESLCHDAPYNWLNFYDVWEHANEMRDPVDRPSAADAASFDARR